MSTGVAALEAHDRLARVVDVGRHLGPCTLGVPIAHELDDARVLANGRAGALDAPPAAPHLHVALGPRAQLVEDLERLGLAGRRVERART
jgi:hypothetical protein